MTNVIKFPIKKEITVRAECMGPWDRGYYQEDTFTDIEKAENFFLSMSSGYDVVEMYDTNMNVLVKTPRDDVWSKNFTDEDMIERHNKIKEDFKNLTNNESVL